MRTLIAVAPLVAVSCLAEPSAFICVSDNACNLAPGERCIDGACANQDPSCPSAFRWETFASDGRSGTCIPLPEEERKDGAIVPVTDGGRMAVDGESSTSDGESLPAQDMTQVADLALLPDLAVLPDLVPETPVSCQDIKDSDPNAADGMFTLYVGGNRGKPWMAYCRDMANMPKEYLPLAMVGQNQNFSMLTGNLNGTTVQTNYQRIRIDPATLSVEIGDTTFSTSAGEIMWGGKDIKSMPYAVAYGCRSGMNDPFAHGNVDLRGTPFAVRPGAFAMGGSPPNSASYSDNDQVVGLSGGGDCGWEAPVGVNDPLAVMGVMLPLVYP